MKRIGHNSKLGCVLNVDMKPEAPWDRSVYGRALTNHGSIWNLDGRYFDGVNDYIDCGNAPSLNNTMTIKTRVKPTGINPISIAPEWGLSYIAGFSTTDLKYTGYNKFSFRLGNISDSQVTASSLTKSLNKFYNITGIYNSSTIKIYINNIEEDITNQTGNIKLSSGDLHIGNFYGYSNSRYFKGFIKSFSIYKHAEPHRLYKV